MKILLQLEGESDVTALKTLKDYIEEISIDEVESVDINRGADQPGQLGVGEILDSISLIIKAATKPLTELAKALQDYVKTFRTSVTITLPDGTKYTIEKGKNSSADDIVKIIEAAKK